MNAIVDFQEFLRNVVVVDESALSFGHHSLLLHLRHSPFTSVHEKPAVCVLFKQNNFRLVVNIYRVKAIPHNADLKND